MKLRSNREPLQVPRCQTNVKYFRDLTSEDIDQLPANATGVAPKDNEAVARFELMVENLRALCESNTISPNKLIEGVLEYHRELENFLYTGSFSGISSVARSIPEDEQERLKYYVDLFVSSRGNALIEYIADKIGELEVKYSSGRRVALTDEHMRSAVTQFCSRVQGEPVGRHGGPTVSPADWAYFAIDLTSLQHGNMLRQLANRGFLMAFNYAPENSEGEVIRRGFFTDNEYVPSSPKLDPISSRSATKLFNDNSDSEQSSQLSLTGSDLPMENDTFSQSDSSTDTDSEDMQDEIPVLQGRNLLSGYDYIQHPFPENRPFEIAESRRIHRDLTVPGVHSDGLHAEDLLDAPPIHCRKPGTYHPRVKRRIPLGPYDVAKSLLSWLGTSVYRSNATQAKPRPGVEIIPRDIARHNKHHRHGRSAIVKPGRKQ